MPTLRITSKAIERYQKAAKASQKPVYLWDTQERGFGCRVAPSGLVSWLVQVWWGGRGGKPKRYVFDAGDLPDARKQAPSYRGQLNKSIDLVRVRQSERKAAREADIKRRGTRLEDVVSDYLRHKPTETERFWRELEGRFASEIVPGLGASAPMAEIAKSDVRRLIRKHLSQGHPVAARTLYEALRPFFKWCVSEDIIPSSPLDTLPAPPLPSARDRILSDDEIKLFWSATDGFLYFGPFYRLLLLTAQRREEVGACEWSEINGDTWTIPGSRTKNGKTHLVHLSPQALAILEAQPKRGPFVFGKTGQSPISGYSKAKLNLDAKLKIPPWRVHDLRRTARSGMARLGIAREVAEKVLNHSLSKNTLDDIYNRYDYLAERKRAVEAWGAYVEQLTSKRASKRGNVVQLRA